MQKQKSSSTNRIRLLRLYSVLTFLACFLVRILVCGDTFPCGVAYDISCACSVLLMQSPGLDFWKKTWSGWLTAATMLISVSFPLLSKCFGGMPAAVVILVNVFPLMMRYHILSRAIISDRDFLAVGVSGWDIAKEQVRQTMMMLLLLLSALAYGLFGVAPGLRWLFVTLLSAFYIFLMVRSYTDRPLVDGLEAEMSEAVMQPAGTVPGDPPYQVLFNRMCKYMRDRLPFLNPKLSLDDVAHELYTNRGYISRMINSCSGLNFPKFINSYRIRYAMDLLKKDPTIKVTDIYPMCGFGSKSAFRAAFQLFTGQSPSDWCQELRDAAEGGSEVKSDKKVGSDSG